MTTLKLWREVETRSKGRCLVVKAAIKAGAEVRAVLAADMYPCYYPRVVCTHASRITPPTD